MKHIYIATSKIEGMGVMIGENAEKGDLIRYIKGEMKFKHIETKKDSLDNPNWVGIGKDAWIDPEKPYKFLNHSCNPSAGVKGKVSLCALKNLKEGEEVTVDYSTIEGDAMWEMKCGCGEKNCRGIIRSIQYLPKETFKKYLPFVPNYFQKLFTSLNLNKKNG